MFLNFRRLAASVLWMLVLLPVAAFAEPASLSLEQAIEEALKKSPRMSAADSSVRAAEGLAYQAGALPNPQLGIEGENIAGSGPYKGTKSAEITYGLSQQIELGGKRSARKGEAGKRQQLAMLDAQKVRLDVIHDVKQAFATAVSAQESLRFAEDANTIADQEMQSVSRRVAEAASPQIQRSKAEVTLATARFNLEQAKQDQIVSRLQLASLLGRSDLTETLDTSWFTHVSEPKETRGNSIERTPDSLRLSAQEEQAAAQLDIEKAGAIPDPTVSVGMRQLRETSDKALVVGLSVPLPVMNSNRGNIDAARAEMSRTQSDAKAAKLALIQRHAEAQGALRTAYIKATSYKKIVLPAAERAFTLSRQGYNAGKFQYLEVLDAQRTLFDARAQYMSALRDYHLRKADVDRLTVPSEAESKGEAHASN